MRTVHKAAVAMLLTVMAAVPSAASAAVRPAVPAHAGYVGTVAGTNAFFAVVVRGSSVAAYLCDSRKVAQWFKGTARAGNVSLTSSGGYVLRITIANRRVTGSVRFPGTAGAVHRVVAARDAKPAGLYRGVTTVAGVRYLGGWIILPDGRQRGEVVSRSTDVASPTLDPSMPTALVKPGKKKPLIVIIAILIG